MEVSLELFLSLLTCLYQGIPKVLGRNNLHLQAMSHELLSLTSLIFVSWWRSFLGISSLLSDGLTQMAVFPCCMRGNKYQCRGNRRKISTVLSFNHYQLTTSCIECHIVNLQSAIRTVPEAYIETNNTESPCTLLLTIVVAWGGHQLVSCTWWSFLWWLGVSLRLQPLLVLGWCH